MATLIAAILSPLRPVWPSQPRRDSGCTTGRPEPSGSPPSASRCSGSRISVVDEPKQPVARRPQPGVASSVVPRPPSDAGEAQGEEEKRTRFLLTPSIRSPRRSDLQKTATLFEAAFTIADGEEIIVDVSELGTLGGGS